MKKLIVFKSKTGFAEKYAKWLAKDLNAEVVPYKQRKKVNFEEYDQVVFATSIFASLVTGLKDMSTRCGSKLVVLAVGFTEMNQDYQDTLKNQNQFTGPLFYVRGGICYEKLNFLAKAMLKKVTKQLTSVDMTNEQYLTEIKEYLGR